MSTRRPLPSADLELSLVAVPEPVVIGGTVTYVLTVTNNGPSDATSITLIDTIPAGVSFLSVTPGSPTCTELAGVVMWPGTPWVRVQHDRQHRRDDQTARR
jgi:uncharacterized repeat protein (TIGR01451 family)